MTNQENRKLREGYKKATEWHDASELPKPRTCVAMLFEHGEIYRGRYDDGWWVFDGFLIDGVPTSFMKMSETETDPIKWQYLSAHPTIDELLK